MNLRGLIEEGNFFLTSSASISPQFSCVQDTSTLQANTQYRTCWKWSTAVGGD